MLEIVPITQSAAKAFVKQHHRHHKPPVGSVFQIACANNGHICGVAIVGRPVARGLQDGVTLEVTRLCTDGSKNACSKLYAAAWRVALVTYILDTEKGTSLIASGWRCVGKTQGGSWDCPSRPRVDKHSLQKKIRFEAGAAAKESKK
jgi:hypothetical protein